MITQQGDKLLVVHRRLFANDAVRFFTCVVEAYDAGVIRATGNSWIKDPMTGHMLGKQDACTKLLPLAAGSILVYVLPRTTDLSNLTFDIDERGGAWLNDAAGVKLDLREQWIE